MPVLSFIEARSLWEMAQKQQQGTDDIWQFRDNKSFCCELQRYYASVADDCSLVHREYFVIE